MVGFRDLVGTGIAPVSKKPAVKTRKYNVNIVVAVLDIMMLISTVNLAKIEWIQC